MGLEGSPFIHGQLECAQTDLLGEEGRSLGQDNLNASSQQSLLPLVLFCMELRSPLLFS